MIERFKEYKYTNVVMIFRNLLCCVICFACWSPVMNVGEYCRKECVVGRYAVYDETGDRVVVLNPKHVKQVVTCKNGSIDLFSMIREQSIDCRHMTVVRKLFVVFIKSSLGQDSIIEELKDYKNARHKDGNEQINQWCAHFVEYLKGTHQLEIDKINEKTLVQIQTHEGLAEIADLPVFEYWQSRVLGCIRHNHDAIASQLESLD